MPAPLRSGRVPTCRTSERVAEVRARLAGATGRGCVVLDERRVVLGSLTPERLDGILVTTSEGELIGIVDRDAAERGHRDRGDD